MKRSLRTKLILSYLAVALITVLVVSVAIRLTSSRSLMSLVVEQQTASLTEAVQTYYTTSGSLGGFFEYYLQSIPQKPGPAESGDPGQPPKSRDVRGVVGLVDTEYQAVMPTFEYKIGQVVPEERIKQSIPVEVDGQVVAWILPDTSRGFDLNPEEQLFLERTTLAITLAALAGVLVALGMSFLLAGGLLKPIRRLTQASQALAGGDLEQQVPVTSQDELGQLTRTFNQMSADLVRADQQRKRLTADITHDLSTPLQIISGYMEMLEEGEVNLTPQRIEIIKTEIEHLRRLVGDLTLLSQVEAGGLEIQLQPIQPSSLLERIHNTYQPIAARQGVALSLDLPASAPLVQVDEGRTVQVLKNLVENALRYTPAGGRVTLKLANLDQKVLLQVSDNGSGIEAEDLPYVFDRFYRADPARSASAGKMGLGLAICKALVTAQGGTISAESGGKNQGTTIMIGFQPVQALQDESHS